MPSPFARRSICRHPGIFLCRSQSGSLRASGNRECENNGTALQPHLLYRSEATENSKKARREIAVKLLTKMTAVAVISSLYIGFASIAVNSASVKGQMAIVGETLKGGTPPLGTRPSVDQSGTLGERSATNCEPLHMS
jgi:hypothetical protein